MILNTNSTSLDKMTTLPGEFYNFTTEILEYNNNSESTAIPTSLPDLIGTIELVVIVVLGIAAVLSFFVVIILCHQCLKAIRAAKKAKNDYDRVDKELDQTKERLAETEVELVEIKKELNETIEELDQARRESAKLEIKYMHLIQLAKVYGYMAKQECDLNIPFNETSGSPSSPSETDKSPTWHRINALVHADIINSPDEETQEAPVPSISSPASKALPKRDGGGDKGAATSDATDASSFVKKVNPKPAGSDEIDKIERLEAIPLKQKEKNETEPLVQRPNSKQSLFEMIKKWRK